MRSSSVGRWLAAGCCAAVVAALHVGASPDAPERAGDAVVATESKIAAAPRVRLAAMPTTTQPQPIALDIALARQAVREGRMRIALPDGTTYPLHIERQETDAFGAWSLIGHVRSPFGPQAAVLTFGNGAVFGTLPMPGGEVLQVATNHGEVVATLAGGMMPPGDAPAASDIATIPVTRGGLRPLVPMLSHAYPRTQGGAVSNATTMPPQPAQALPPTAAAALPTITVTVLATYADDLIAKRGSEAAVKTDLSNLIAAANQAHIDSGSRVRLKLAGTAKLAIPADWSNTDALYAMTVAPIGDVDTEILRNTYSADLVTFVRPYADYENCGIAWVGGVGLHGADFDSLFAYSVVNREPCGPHVVAHETGHNLGAAHDRETETNDYAYDANFGAYTDSFGWRGWSGHEFADVMAYNTRGEPWLGYFSTPLLNKCNWSACGVAGRADVVHTFDRTAQTVSEFRRTNGKGSVSDTSTQSWCPAHETLKFPIRLSVQKNTEVSVDVAIVAGANYIVQPGSEDTHIVFAPFQQQAVFEAEAISCGDLPSTRQVTIKLVNPVGFTLEDDTAVGTINEIQPVRIEGFLTPPDPWFGENMTVTATGALGPRDSQATWDTGYAPWYFQFDVVPGSNVLLQAKEYYFPTWMIEPTFLTDVRTPPPFPLNIPIVRAVRIDADLRLPASQGGYSIPATGQYSATFRATYKGRVLEDGPIQLGGRFSRYVVPGSTIEIFLSAASSAPSASFLYRQFDVRQDLDFRIDTLLDAGAFPVGDRRLREGAPGVRTLVPVGIQLTKATTAPARVYWRTVDGTASAGADYVAASGTVDFAAGETFKQFAVEIIGDAVAEPDEYFDIELYQASGVGITTNRTRIDVLRDEPNTGGPGRKTVAK